MQGSFAALALLAAREAGATGRFEPIQTFNHVPHIYYCPQYAGSCAVVEGLAQGARAGDVLFFDNAAGVTGDLLDGVFGVGVPDHVAVCAASAVIGGQDYCHTVGHNTSDTDASNLPANAGGIAPNAGLLTNMTPGTSSMAIGTHFDLIGNGWRARPIDPNYGNELAWAFTYGFFSWNGYNIAGFTSHVPQAHCAEFVADHGGIYPSEGARTTCIGAATVAAIIPSLWDGVYAAVVENIIEQMTYGGSFAGLAGELALSMDVPGKIANQAVHAFLGVPDNDNGDGARGLTRNVVGVTAPAELFSVLAYGSPGGHGSFSCAQAGPTCGDGLCDVSEVHAGARNGDQKVRNTTTCPIDCALPVTGAGGGGVCGDGWCSPYESMTFSCSADCNPAPVCGNAVCEFLEELSCPSDCGIGYCGDGICGNDTWICDLDCGTGGGGGGSSNGCGNGTCEMDDAAASCTSDCGAIVDAGSLSYSAANTNWAANPINSFAAGFGLYGGGHLFLSTCAEDGGSHSGGTSIRFVDEGTGQDVYPSGHLFYGCADGNGTRVLWQPPAGNTDLTVYLGCTGNSACSATVVYKISQ